MAVSISGDGAVTGVASINTDVSSTEIGYLDGVTSAVQTQMDAKLASTTYETGTWTATLPNGGTFNGPTTSSQPYTKVGNLVTIWFDARMASVPNNSNQFTIGGLPYQPNFFASAVVGSYARGFGSGPVNVNASTSTPVVTFNKSQTSTSGGTTAVTNATPSAAVNNFDVAFVLTYRTAT